MSTKHTPGPWEVMDSFYPSIKEVFGASFKISCVMWATDLTEEDYQKRRADLRLIAAAPELLEAVKALIEGYENTEHTGLMDMQVCGSDIIKARAAIAKATGEQL